MELNLLRYPKKSHRKIIKIPSESTELAELMGIIAGDGGINNEWQLVISLNSIKDLKYSRYIYQLLKNLFDIGVMIRKRKNQNALILVCSSVTLVDFLVAKGAIRGNKILGGLDAPFWVKNNPDYEKAFVRGLVDTDGCLYIHKHTVKGEFRKDIGFCFTNNAGNIIRAAVKILNNIGLNPHISRKQNRVYLYGKEQINKYLKIIGSSNDRISNKYIKWRGARAV